MKTGYGPIAAFIASSVLVFSVGQRASCNPKVYESSFAEKEQSEILAVLEQNRKKMGLELKRRHIGLEIIVAGETSARLESLFGHAVLRLLDDDREPLNDTIIAFKMFTLNSKDSYKHGLLGGWENYPIAMNFATYLSQYALGEERASRRLLIPSSAERIQKLKEALRKILNLPDFIGDYNFITNNCATALLKLLAHAGYKIPTAWPEVPVSLPNILQQSMNTFTPVTPLPHFGSLISGIFNQFKKRNPHSQAKDWKSALDHDDFWSFISSDADEKSVAYAIYLWPYNLNTYGAKTLEVIDNHRAALSKYPVQSLIYEFPKSFYEVCAVTDSLCRKQRLTDIKNRGMQTWLKGAQKIPLEWETQSRRIVHESAAAAKARGAILNDPVILDMKKLGEELAELP